MIPATYTYPACVCAGEESPDAYLAPVVAALGEHQGLNAGWSCMAWHIKGDVWLVDDETGNTVSLVSVDDEGTATSFAWGEVAIVLPLALKLRAEGGAL